MDYITPSHYVDRCWPRFPAQILSLHQKNETELKWYGHSFVHWRLKCSTLLNKPIFISKRASNKGDCFFSSVVFMPLIMLTRYNRFYTGSSFGDANVLSYRRSCFLQIRFIMLCRKIANTGHSSEAQHSFKPEYLTYSFLLQRPIYN